MGKPYVFLSNFIKGPVFQFQKTSVEVKFTCSVMHRCDVYNLISFDKFV